MAWVPYTYVRDASDLEVIGGCDIVTLFVFCQVSDETFIAKLNKHCIGHAHFESRASKQFLSDMSLPHDCFRLKHYAGSVSV